MSTPRPSSPAGRSQVLAATSLTGIALTGIMLLCMAAALSAVLELLLVPLRDGTVMVPVSVLFAVIGGIALPRMGRAFAVRTGAMLAPFLAWLVPLVLLALTGRPEGDVLVPGGGGEQWVFYLTLLGGGVAGMVTVATGAPSRRAAPARTR